MRHPGYADLHLVAALPVAAYVEYLTPSPYTEDILHNPIKMNQDGLLEIPTTPGLGIELDYSTVERMSGMRSLGEIRLSNVRAHH